MNPNALHLLFGLDYKKMKENNGNLNEDLCKYVFNPKRLNTLVEKFEIDVVDYLEII